VFIFNLVDALTQVLFEMPLKEEIVLRIMNKFLLAFELETGAFAIALYHVHKTTNVWFHITLLLFTRKFGQLCAVLEMILMRYLFCGFSGALG
jgi:hypothetical protein